MERIAERESTALEKPQRLVVAFEQISSSRNSRDAPDSKRQPGSPVYSLGAVSKTSPPNLPAIRL